LKDIFYFRAFSRIGGFKLIRVLGLGMALAPPLPMSLRRSEEKLGMGLKLLQEKRDQMFRYLFSPANV
jgi:hypothetical protein